ncbi:MAG: hypothetical protein L6R41_003747 [Letrouitia leprolyta]|nr:MAG: hypothetical protein L6R41_003747 [Letrouitia leprolyta]
MATKLKTSPTNPILNHDSSIDIHYLAEGAANVVFILYSKRGISTLDDDFGEPGTTTEDGVPRIDPRLKGKLLRLRKDLPFIAPVADSHRHFEEQIAPLFPPEILVEQLLCNVSPDFITKCNEELWSLEEHGLRPKKRLGVYLAENEPYATAITDMRSDDQHACCDFKPKWLAQSPTAPPDSKRCRTCALRAMRAVKDAGSLERTGFCPLTLVDGNQNYLASSLGRALGHSKGTPINIPDFVQQLRPFFEKSPLFELLRDLQIKKDPKGILRADPNDVDFMTAMTIRDCTLFLKVSCLNLLYYNNLTTILKIPNHEGNEAKIETRLGDLDLKTPEGNKAEYWRETEQQLIDGGWYTATEERTFTQRKDDPVCLLSKAST